MTELREARFAPQSLTASNPHLETLSVILLTYGSQKDISRNVSYIVAFFQFIVIDLSVLFSILNIYSLIKIFSDFLTSPLSYLIHFSMKLEFRRITLPLLCNLNFICRRYLIFEIIEMGSTLLVLQNCLFCLNMPNGDI